MKVSVIFLVLRFRLKLQLNVPSLHTCYLLLVRGKFCTLVDTWVLAASCQISSSY